MKLIEILPNLIVEADLQTLSLRRMKFKSVVNDALDLGAYQLRILSETDSYTVFFGREKITKEIYISDDFWHDLIHGMFHEISSFSGVPVEAVESESELMITQMAGVSVKITPQVRRFGDSGLEVVLNLIPDCDPGHGREGGHKIGPVGDTTSLVKFGRSLSTWRERALSLIVRERKHFSSVCAYLADAYHLDREFRQLERPYFADVKPTVISQSDKAFAARMLKIAHAYGFRYYGALGGGSFHFRIEYPEYSQQIRIYVSDWPVSVEISLGEIHAHSEEYAYTNIRQQACGRYIQRTPRSEFMNQFIALLEKSQVMRADFQAGGRMG